MRQWIAKKLLGLSFWIRGESEKLNELITVSAGRPHSHGLESQPTSVVSIRKALNGKVLELSTWVPNQPSSLRSTSDGHWRTSMYVVKEGEPITDAVATLLVSGSLER